MPDITLYTKQNCAYCHAAKELLKSKGVKSWQEFDVERDTSKRNEMIAKTGRFTVPQIFIGEKHIGGFDDVRALDESGELDSLLK